MRTGEPGPADEPSLVRPYALVRGRTRRGADAPLPVEAVIVAVDSTDEAPLRLERADIVKLCQTPHSVAEISAGLTLPIGVVRVLVADLAADGYVSVNLPLEHPAGQPGDLVLLERVLAGFKAL